MFCSPIRTPWSCAWSTMGPIKMDVPSDWWWIASPANASDQWWSRWPPTRSSYVVPVVVVMNVLLFRP